MSAKDLTTASKDDDDDDHDESFLSLDPRTAVAPMIFPRDHHGDPFLAGPLASSLLRQTSCRSAMMRNLPSLLDVIAEEIFDHG